MVQANSADRSNTRKAEVWIKDERLGKVSLGKGDMASNGSSEVDLSSTTVLSYSGMADWGGGYFFRTNGGNFGPAIGRAWNNLDGDTRQNRIRYDTPSFGGFTLSASHRRDVADIAVRFKKEWNSVRCAAAAAYAHDTGDKDYDFENWSSSASCIHTPSGLNLTVAYADRDFGNGNGAAFDAEVDTDFYYVKLGIARRWNSHGKTAISIGYGETSDSVSQGDDTTALGIDFVQFIDSAALELFAGYRHWEYDDDQVGISYQDMDHVIMGARMKF
jgi:hypothetical protein